MIVVVNSTSNTVTGGVALGTTSGGTDVYTTLAVSGIGAFWCADASLSKRWFSSSANQVLYCKAVTSWNSASVTVYVTVAQF